LIDVPMHAAICRHKAQDRIDKRALYLVQVAGRNDPLREFRGVIF
jgi:hypothetical protein